MSTPTTKTIEQAADHPLRNTLSKTGRFLLHLIEMLIAMQVGMTVFHLMLGLIHIYSNSRALDAGTPLHGITMTVFMTVPMVAWMIFRGHGWRHVIEMAVAMIAPTVLIAILCQLGIDGPLPWLPGLSMPFMLLGMILAMLYRRDHYTGAKRHAVDHANVDHADMEHADVDSELACH